MVTTRSGVRPAVELGTGVIRATSVRRLSSTIVRSSDEWPRVCDGLKRPGWLALARVPLEVRVKMSSRALRDSGESSSLPARRSSRVKSSASLAGSVALSAVEATSATRDASWTASTASTPFLPIFTPFARSPKSGTAPTTDQPNPPQSPSVA
jgi:hypothetical protein